MLDTLFGTTGHLTWWQECARAVVVFAYGLALVRVAGRRVFGKWSALDIVVSIVVGSNLSRVLTGGAPLWETMAATTLFMALHFIFAHVATRSPAWSRLLEGNPIVLGADGHVKDDELKRRAVSPSDLDEALHNAGIERIEEARRVILEPSGKISLSKKD